jgi:hypothetical protein
VEIDMDHPDQVNAGELFQVTVTITKGSLTDYSRFSQDLPEGLTASNVSSPNADFSFDDQRIRIIWLKMPVEQQVKVTYNIQVHERLKGTFILGGVFAYVVEEERKFLNFEKSREITIIPNPDIDPALVVNIRDFKGSAAGVPADGTSDPSASSGDPSAGSSEPVARSDESPEFIAGAVRQKPLLLGTGGYLVRLLVKNPLGSKYVKIEESIPSGYLFESVDPHSGIESFASSTVKFIWMKIPTESEYEVVYRLVPKQGEPQGAMAINGVLTYSTGSENKEVDITEMDVAIDQLTIAQKKELLRTGKVPAGASPATSAASTAASGAARTGTQSGSGTEPVPEMRVPSSATTSSSPGQSIKNTPVLSASPGTYYRIQLTANRKAIDAKVHFSDAGLGREVHVEQHEGLYKYTVGNFPSYSQASEYKKRVEGLPGVKGIFVVAYQEGKRIPVRGNR